MARTAVTIAKFVRNGYLVDPAGTTVDPTNGHYIDAGGLTGKILIRVTNTHSATHTATVKAGTSNPPAFRKDEGDEVSAAIAATTGVGWLGPFESAQFVQPAGGTDGGAGGRIFVDLDAGITGKITAFQMP